MNYPYRSYYQTNEMRFGPLIPFIGGLLVGGLFAPRPNGGFIPNSYPSGGPAYPMVAPPMYGPPMYGPPMYGPLPYQSNNYMPVVNQEVPTYFTSVQADNVDIYPYQSTPRPY